MKKNVLLLAAILSLNSIAVSQTENLLTEKIDIINKKFFDLDEIVVSAKGWQQQKTDVAFPITTISKENVLFDNPQTAADLLGNTNKVFIQKSQQGGGSPMIRGFATNRLLYTIDGVRMNTAIFRAGNIQNIISLDPFAIENTEVIFGAGPVLYGSDAIGGVMAFQTLAPTFSDNDDIFIKGNSVVRYSSANQEKTGHFDINIGSKKFASVASISYNNFGDLRMGSDGPDEYLRTKYVMRIDNKDVEVANSNPLVQSPTGYDQYNCMYKAMYILNEKIDLFGAIHYSETSNYPRYDRLVRERNNVLRDAEWYYGPQKWLFANVGFEINNVDWLFFDKLFDKIRHTFALQNFEESRNNRDFNKNILAATKEKVKAVSVNVDLYKTLNDNSNLYYGVEIVANDVKSTGIDSNIVDKTIKPRASRYPQADWSSTAAYISSDYKLSDIFKLETGIRYNQYKLSADFTNNLPFYNFPFTETKINNGALTGNLGLIAKPVNDWIFQLNLSTASRSPNVDDMGKIFDSHEGCVTIPNPDLKSEYAYNGNIGITKLFGKYAKINLNAYYTYLDNAMVCRYFQLNGQDSIMYNGELRQVEAIQNAASANVYGIDADVELKLSSFIFSVFANYQKGEEELDDASKSPLRHAPPFFGKIAFRYVNTKVLLNLYLCYASEVSNENLPRDEQGKPEIYAKDNNGSPYCPSWLTLNFKAEYLLDNTWSISAGLENILDTRYRPYSSGIVAPGRNFILSLISRF